MLLTIFHFDLPPLRKPRKAKAKVKVNGDWKVRYQKAHEKWFSIKYPSAYSIGGYTGATFPKIETGNGLNRAIENFLTWEGHRATRISSGGRMVKGKFISGSTRNGAADVSSTINGRCCQWEGKAGKDQPRPDQLREQGIERAAGGVYEFIHNMDELYFYYDKVISHEI